MNHPYETSQQSNILFIFLFMTAEKQAKVASGTLQNAIWKVYAAFEVTKFHKLLPFPKKFGYWQFLAYICFHQDVLLITTCDCFTFNSLQSVNAALQQACFQLVLNFLVCYGTSLK
jgi:hypothetical protein